MAQISAHRPIGLDSLIYSSIPIFNLPISSSRIRVNRYAQSSIKDPYVANNYQLSLTAQNSGTWYSIKEPYDKWQLRLRSEGAHAIGLVLSNIKLHAGDLLYIYNRRGVGSSYTLQDIPKSGVLPIPYIPGEEIVIEYKTITKESSGSFNVESISHAYRDVLDQNTLYNSVALDTTKIGDCYMCLEGDSIALAKRSVVKIVIHDEEGTKYCTGTLMNNTAKDGRSYLLTAEHCISNEVEAQRSIFIFNPDGQCNQLNSNDSKWLYGAHLLASSYENDYALVELDQRPPLAFRPYFAGWNFTSSPSTNVLSIHHPKGGSKKISFSSAKVNSSNFANDSTRALHAFWKVKKWETGITERGSSGAALFNSDFQVIGSLSGGSAKCSFPYNDYFQKLADSPDLKQWLDPIVLGVNEFSGFDPFDNITPSCDTISNINEGESIELIPYPSGNGYYSGYNSDGIDTYAEKFIVEDSVLVIGASFSIGKIDTNAPGGIIVSLHSMDENGLPGSTLYETYAPFRTLIDRLGYIEFYPYVKISGTFFISFQLSFSSEDVFAVYQVAWRDHGKNTAYAKLASGWVSMTRISPQRAGTSFDINVHICRDILPVTKEDKQMIEFYPNPTSQTIIAKLSFELPEQFNLHVYDVQGRKQAVAFQVIDNSLIIDLSTLMPNLYLLEIATQKAYVAKIIKN